jgi:hypothetical protein
MISRSEGAVVETEGWNSVQMPPSCRRGLGIVGWFYARCYGGNLPLVLYAAFFGPYEIGFLDGDGLVIDVSVQVAALVRRPADL